MLDLMSKIDMGGHSLLDESVVFIGSELSTPASHARSICSASGNHGEASRDLDETLSLPSGTRRHQGETQVRDAALRPLPPTSDARRHRAFVT